MNRYFSLPKQGVVGKELELTKGQFDVEIGDYLAKSFEGEEDQWEAYCEEKEPELIKAAESVSGLDIGDYVIYSRQDSDIEDIELEYKHSYRPFYLYDCESYDTLEEAIKAKENC